MTWTMVFTSRPRPFARSTSQTWSQSGVAKTRVFATTTGETESGADEHLIALHKSSHKQRINPWLAHRVLNQWVADEDAAGSFQARGDIMTGTGIEVQGHRAGSHEMPHCQVISRINRRTTFMIRPMCHPVRLRRDLPGGLPEATADLAPQLGTSPQRPLVRVLPGGGVGQMVATPATEPPAQAGVHRPSAAAARAQELRPLVPRVASGVLDPHGPVDRLPVLARPARYDPL